MTRAPGTYWTFWPNPDPVIFGDASYEWGFVLKVNLTAILGLLVLFALPPVQAWTGCDLRVLAAAFGLQFFYAVVLNLYGLKRVNPRAREFGSHLVNIIAVTAIPLSSEKSLFALWLLYPLIIWMDGYSNPKSVSSLLTSVSIPWLDPLWHAGGATGREKLMMAAVSVGLGVVIYLVSSYFAGWSRAGTRRTAEEESERAAREERERIGRSLHGTLGAALSEITLWHEIALANGGDGATGEAAPISRAHERAKSALTDLRALVAGLDDPQHQRVSAAALASGIRRQTEGLCDAARVTLDFPAPAGGSIDMSTAYHAAKIAVECVTNAVRHAHCARVDVALGLSPLRLVVADDGAGFDASAAQHGRGLRSLREHADAVGGSLAIESSAGGTRVSLTLPS